MATRPLIQRSHVLQLRALLAVHKIGSASTMVYATILMEISMDGTAAQTRVGSRQGALPTCALTVKALHIPV